MKNGFSLTQGIVLLQKPFESPCYDLYLPQFAFDLR